jgi:hypothetical protein
MSYLAASRMGRLGIIPAMIDSGGQIARSNIMLWRPPIKGPVLPGPMPVWGGTGGSVGPIVTGPVTYNPPASASTLPPNPTPSLPPASSANAGTPVPAGYSTSQIFVDPNGTFWEYSASQNQWMNVGTPYNTGASAGVPPVTPGTTPSAPTALTTPTTAPAPVNVSVAAASSSYQSILDWLQQDTLGATVGFSSIPNWIVAAGAAALAWKFSQPASRSRNPLHRRRHR